jgi:hypothetical protein
MERGARAAQAYDTFDPVKPQHSVAAAARRKREGRRRARLFAPPAQTGTPSRPTDSAPFCTVARAQVFRLVHHWRSTRHPSRARRSIGSTTAPAALPPPAARLALARQFGFFWSRYEIHGLGAEEEVKSAPCHGAATQKPRKTRAPGNAHGAHVASCRSRARAAQQEASPGAISPSRSKSARSACASSPRSTRSYAVRAKTGEERSKRKEG